MTSTSHTVPATSQPAPRRTAPAAGGSQWWKAWLLLTSLGVTTLGWMALPEPGPRTGSGIATTPTPTPAAPANRVRVQVPGDLARRTAPTALRAIPQRPVFRTPVTRTRRS